MQGGYFESAHRARAPDRLGDRLHRHLAARPGPRDRLRADRRRPARRRRPTQVEVIHGDTATGPFGKDTYGSRSLAVGGEAIARAADKVVDKAKRIVAHKLEAAPEDIEVRDGKFSVKGSPDKGMTLAEVAGEAYIPDRPARGHGAGARGDVVLRPGELLWPFGAHACVVDVDVGDGQGRRSSATSRSTTAARRSTRC